MHLLHFKQEAWDLNSNSVQCVGLETVILDAGTVVSLDHRIVPQVIACISFFPPRQARNYSIRLNHTSLLTAVLNHCGIPEDKHHEVYKILSDARTEKLTKTQIQTRLCSMSLSEQQVSESP